MKNWLRKILGIDTMDKVIIENNFETQSKLESISKLLESNKKDNLTDLVETISQFQFSNDSDLIDFKIDDNLQLDENWALLKLANQEESWPFCQFT